MGPEISDPCPSERAFKGGPDVSDKAALSVGENVLRGQLLSFPDAFETLLQIMIDRYLPRFIGLRLIQINKPVSDLRPLQ